MLSPLRAETGRDPPCVSSTTEKSPSTLLRGRRGTKIQAVSSLCEPQYLDSEGHVRLSSMSQIVAQHSRGLPIRKNYFELNQGLLSAAKGGLICVIIEAAPILNPLICLYSFLYAMKFLFANVIIAVKYVFPLVTFTFSLLQLKHHCT